MLSLANVYAREPYLVYLLPGSKIELIEDQSVIYTSKGMYVYAMEVNLNYRKEFWIYSTKKEKKFITSAMNIKELFPEMRLLPFVPEDHGYEQKRIIRTDDKLAPFETNLALNFEQMSMNEMSPIYSTQSGSMTATRFEIRSLYQTEKPLQFGANFNFQNIFWDNSSESIRLSLISVGPVFSYKLLEQENFSLSLLASAELAIMAKGSSAQNNEEFSSHAFDIGLSGDIPTEIGMLTLGTHIRRNYLLLNNTTRTNLTAPPNEYQLTSLGISLGYKFDWEL
jgi:hypothetical protein